MSKSYKGKITLVCGMPEIKTTMLQFFDRYRNELPMFIKESLEAMKIDSDPSMIFKKDVIEFNRVTLDKGMVFILKDETLTLVNYKLVADDERYIKYVDGRLFIFFKRNGGTPDSQVGFFENFDLANTGFHAIEDPNVAIEKIAAQAKLDAAEMKETMSNEASQDDNRSKMEVSK